jgi:parallel beta-helix repeat protein
VWPIAAVLCLALAGMPHAATSSQLASSGAELPTPYALQSDCSESLQRRIDRESITINRPLVLRGVSGSEIRGSDVWATGWVPSGRFWVHGGAPAYTHAGVCKPNTDGRCHWAEQVFFNGAPLRQVATNPTSGQFSIEGGRVVLADDPKGATLEVTTRASWITVAANDVTIEGFVMRHAANAAQQGALLTDNHAVNVIVRGNTLSDAHGAVVRGWGMELIGNDISRGGQLGVAGGGIVMGNRIHDNNTEEFDPGWGAGGLKSTALTGGFWESNSVYGNDGPGLWCDGGCTGVTISNNRVFNNSYQGILYELSSGGTIAGNAVWANGFSYSFFGGGSGIALSTSATTQVRGNVTAWNAAGIAVLNIDRGPQYPIGGNSITDNVIALSQNGVALGRMGEQRSLRGGAPDTSRGNRFWYGVQENSLVRYVWDREFALLAELAHSTGESSSYLSDADLALRLTTAGVPPRG